MNIFRRKSKQASTTETQSVLVIDAKKGIKIEKKKPVGRPWLLDGKLVYVAKHDDKNGGELVPYDPLQEWRSSDRMKKAKAQTPEGLFDAINWPEVKSVYRQKPNLLEKLNPLLMIGLVGILCFFIFLIYSSATGG